MAEDAWNTRDPVRVSLAYAPDSVWRNFPDAHPCLSDLGCESATLKCRTPTITHPRFE